MAKCTPEYNDETRRLMAQAADLRRIAKGAETGDFSVAARAKANEVIDAGETDPAKVVDAVHAFLNEHLPLAKDEVASLIAETKPRTRSEATARRAEVLAELRDLQKIQKGLDAENATRKAKSESQSKARINAQIADLSRQIESGVNTAKEKGQPINTPEIAELRRQRDALRRQRDMQEPSPPATRPVDPRVAKNKAALARAKKQEAELTRQLETNDFPQRQKRVEPDYSEEVRQAKMKVAALKVQTDAAIEKGNRLNQSGFKTALELLHAEQLFNIFTSPKVLLKLAYAVAGGHVHAFLQGGTVSLARMIPALRKIADQAPEYGAGLSVEGLKARYGAGVKAIPKAMKETLQQGATQEEIASGNPSHYSDAFLYHIGTLGDALRTEGKLNRAAEVARVVTSYPARIHGVEKTMLSVPAMYESRVNQAIQITRAMKAAGKTPEEISEFLNRESIKATINARSVARGYDEKMQGKNRWNDAFLANIRQLEKSNNPGANFAAFLFRTVLPVVRVGPNVFKQGTSIMFGSIKAALEAAGKGEMTPERADYIMKNIGAQGTGAVLIALGIVYRNQLNLGGIPGAAPKKPAPSEPQPGEGTIGGLQVGGEAFHGAPFAMLQMGAGLARVYEQEMKDNPKENPINAALWSLGSNVKNWGERTLPYTDLIRRTANTLEYGRNRGKEGTPWGEVAGNQLRSMVIPQAVQQEAAREDPNKNYLRPRNISEDIMSGIPGQRQKVPHSNKGPPGAKP